MREIEFRAWDRDQKRMVYPGTGVANNLESWEILQLFDVVMQYTGRKDENSKEIWEGDKLEYSIDGHKQAVPYIIEDMTDWFEEMYNTDSYYRWDNQGKVIGNIYENPKLLEKP